MSELKWRTLLHNALAVVVVSCSFVLAGPLAVSASSHLITFCSVAHDWLKAVAICSKSVVFAMNIK